MSRPLYFCNMDRFPAEFEDLLNRRGRRLIADAPQLESLMARRQTPIVFLEDVIDRGVAKECIRLLDESMYPRLRRMHTPIPREALTRMKRNYTDTLPKTVRVRTAMFNGGRSKALETAEERGYYESLNHDYAARMEKLLAALERAGLKPIRPEGTYFIMSDISGLGFKDDVDFAMYMTTEVGVACIPPSAFYQDPADGAFLCRWCFAKTDATLEAAEERLMAWAARTRREA